MEVDGRTYQLAARFPASQFDSVRLKALMVNAGIPEYGYRLMGEKNNVALWISDLKDYEKFVAIVEPQYRMAAPFKDAAMSSPKIDDASGNERNLRTRIMGRDF